MRQKQEHSHTEFFTDSKEAVSGIRDWNAGGKMALAVAALIICIAANQIWVSVAILLLSLLIWTIPGGGNVREFLRMMRIPLVFIVLGSAATAIELAGSPVGTYRFSVGNIWIGVSEEGMLSAVAIFLKALGAVSAMYLLTLSTTMEEILGVLRKVHCPALLLELMHMIYRNIFILMQMYSRMQTAAEARMGYRDFRTSLRSFGQIGANLFFLSLGRADKLYDAMLARGYEGRLEFLEQKKPVQRLQIIWSIAYVGIALALWAAAAFLK